MVCVFFVSTFGMNFQVTNALMSREAFHTGVRACCSRPPEHSVCWRWPLA